MARQVRRMPTPEQKRRKLLYTILWIIGGLVVVVIAGAALVMMQIGGKPPLPPDVARGLEDGARTSSAVSDVAQLQQAVAAGQSRPVHLDLSNADINAIFLAEVGNDPRAGGFEVLLGDGRALIRGVVTEKGRTFNVQATLTITPDSGSIRANLGDLWIGSFKAPAPLKEQLQESINKSLAKHTPQSFGLYVESVAIRPGHVTLKGHTIPRR